MPNAIVYSVEPVTYQGEQWYFAQGGLSGCTLVEASYARTAGRAVGFVMQKLAHYLVTGIVDIEVEPLPRSMTIEAVEVRCDLGMPS